MEAVRAVYQKGIFVPLVVCDLPEDTEVELIVQAVSAEPLQVADPDHRALLLQEVVRSMQRNPIPANAPALTREELHARR